MCVCLAVQRATARSTSSVKRSHVRIYNCFRNLPAKSHVIRFAICPTFDRTIGYCIIIKPTLLIISQSRTQQCVLGIIILLHLLCVILNSRNASILFQHVIYRHVHFILRATRRSVLRDRTNKHKSSLYRQFQIFESSSQRKYYSD